MSVDVTYDSRLLIAETITVGVDGADNPVIYHGGPESDFASLARFTGTTTPDVVDHVTKVFTLTAGAYTLDLTSMVGTGSVAKDGTTYKVRFLKITNNHATQTLKVAKGASNGHTGFGSDFAVTVDGAGEITLKFGSVAIASNNKTLDFTGTGSNTFNLSVVYG